MKITLDISIAEMIEMTTKNEVTVTPSIGDDNNIYEPSDIMKYITTINEVNVYEIIKDTYIAYYGPRGDDRYEDTDIERLVSRTINKYNKLQGV